VAQPLAVKQDQAAARRLDGVARLDVDSPVGADELPVGAVRQDAALELCAFDLPAQKILITRRSPAGVGPNWRRSANSTWTRKMGSAEIVVESPTIAGQMFQERI
jgi:hypothetical protein